MNSFILQCTICALHFGLADGKSDGILVKDVMEMSDRELREFLVTRLSQQEKRIDDQNEVLKSLQKALQEKDSVREKHAQTFTAHEEQQVRKARRTRRQVSGTPVAFSALLTHNLDHLGAHQSIAFDKTYINTNNVYNPHHGVFTVPVSGVYVITATVFANANREVWGELVVNGLLKAMVYARGTDNRFDQGSQTILLHLNQGDDVAVQNYALDDSIYGGLYTTFSGFLLFEEEQLGIVG